MYARLTWLFWETLIIVVGVLLALSVNDFWNDRQERKLELDYLQRLRSEIQTDIETADWYLAERITRKMVALDAIAPVVRGHAEVPDDVESFLREVSVAAFGGVSPSKLVSDTTFDDLTVTGNLRLIRDTEIRRKLSDYYRSAEEFVNRQRARVSGYPRFLHSIQPGELREKYNWEAMQTFGIERSLERIRSPEFEDLMNQEYNLGWFTIEAYQAQRDAAARLLGDLDAYIANRQR